MNKQGKEKIIIFEEINRSQWLVLFWHIVQSHQIYYFRINPVLKNHYWICFCQNKSYIKPIGFNPRISFFDGYDDEEALLYVDKLFEFYLEKNPHLKEMVRLYEDKNIELTLKNSLLKKLSRVFYVQKNFNKSSHLLSSLNKKLLFVPMISNGMIKPSSNVISDYNLYMNHLDREDQFFHRNEKVCFPLWVEVISRIKTIFHKIALVTIVKILPLVFLFKKRKDKPAVHKKFKYGIFVLSERQFENEIKPVEFLIDEESIKSEEVVFIPYGTMSERQVENLKKKRLNYLDSVDGKFSEKYVKHVRPYLSSLLKSTFLSQVDGVKLSLKLIYYYVKWNSVADRIGLEHLITQVTDNSEQSVMRNSIFRKRETKIWEYMDSIGLSNYYVPKEKFQQATLSFLSNKYCDNLVVWSASSKEIFQAKNSFISKSFIVGCLWSEITRFILEGKIKSDLIGSLKKSGYRENMKLVAAFDTTYVHYSNSPLSDGVDFLQIILKLLDNFPNIFVVLKEKKTQFYYQNNEFMEIVRCYDELKAHPRVHLAQNNVCPSEVIALCDLAIGIPFTTPIFEALSIKKKAIWADPSNRFRGSYYDSAPGLICHSYEEIQKRVHSLLYEISTKQYVEHLEQQMDKQICSYFDGKGITRFRELLVGQEQQIKTIEERNFKSLGV